MAGKLAVYLCSGYGIAEAVDLAALRKVAASELSAEIVKIIPGAEADDLAQIRRELEAEGIGKIVIAGPSPRHYGRTTFPPNVQVDYANLREQVAWLMPPNNEDTQALAEDNLRMAAAKVKKMEELVPFEGHADINKDILVVGGGMAGLTAALECANTGYRVHLVEKDGGLGGFAKRLYKSIPHHAPYQRLEDTGVEELIAKVQGHEKITVITGARIKKIAGGPGLFDVELEGRDVFRCGAIVQATGWKPAEPTHLAHLGYQRLPDVVTSVEFEAMAKQGKIARPSNRARAESVLFVQNEGAPLPDQFSYSSSINSLNAIKQAIYLREQSADAKAIVVYDMFKAPGHHELFYKFAQQDPGIFLTKGKVVAVEPRDGQLAVQVDDTLLGKAIELEVDLVVLGVGMVPVAADGEKLRTLLDAKEVIAKGEVGPRLDRAKEDARTLAGLDGTQILNLEYRQGPDLPTLTWGYPDSHFICFPYESRRTGVYPCGCMRSPMDLQGAIEDATGAALKAIQCVELTGRGEAVHPRAGDQSYPDFFLQRCTLCKRCTEECPFGVLDEDDQGTPRPHPTRCRRCGVCMGACPERIVSFKDYSVAMVADMIKAVEVPDEFEEKPRVLCLACENDAYPALDQIGKQGLKISPHLRVIPVRCLGSVNIVWVNEALSKGFDGIIFFGCRWGDDAQCHFGKGAELMVARSANVKEKLQQMALENERVQLHELEITDAEKAAKILNEFMETIAAVGFNPFKGM